MNKIERIMIFDWCRKPLNECVRHMNEPERTATKIHFTHSYTDDFKYDHVCTKASDSTVNTTQKRITYDKHRVMMGSILGCLQFSKHVLHINTHTEKPNIPYIFCLQKILEDKNLE